LLELDRRFGTPWDRFGARRSAIFLPPPGWRAALLRSPRSPLPRARPRGYPGTSAGARSPPPRGAGRPAVACGAGDCAAGRGGGVCVWRRGRRRDGADSFAEQIFPDRHWPRLRLLAVVLAAEEKEVSSREGMRRSVETSPFYSAWVADAEAEVTQATARIAARDLAGLGEIAERNAWRMHAVALSADPVL